MPTAKPANVTDAALPGPRKAAILLLAMGEARAADVLGRLTPDQAEALAMEITVAPRTDSDTVRAIVQEALDDALAREYLGEGGLEYARVALERSVGRDRADEILGRLAARLEQRPFQFLNRTPPEHIATFLRAESPQTAAIVIANLHSAAAANVLAQFGGDEQAEVARRIASLAEVRPEVPGIVEAVMRQRLASVVAEGSSAGGTQALADILTSAGRSTERHVLDTLEDQDAELADEVRALLFTFDDVVKLDDRSMQLVLREIEQKDLAVALRGVDDAVRRHVYDNMSARGAELLREELEFQPPQRRRVVEEAQGRIVAVIRRLEEADAITLGGAGDDELL